MYKNNATDDPPLDHTGPPRRRGLTRYALLGAAFGLLFPLASLATLWVFDPRVHTPNLLDFVAEAHNRNILLYVIDTVPLFLGLVAGLAGMRQDQLVRLSASLERQVEQKTRSLSDALSKAQAAAETVSFMADHDPLTGLLNRRRFKTELDRWSRYAVRYQRCISLMFIDLDHFKEINDVYGHIAGDQYLVGVSDALLKVLRSTDYIARWGGDEIAILLTEADSSIGGEIAGKLLGQLRANPIEFAGGSLHAAISIGIASVPDHTNDVSELLAFADAAMYQAKQHGGSRAMIYSANRDATLAQGHAHWVSRIRRALQTDQFRLFYQPLRDLWTERTSEYEALLRMEDTDGQLINPGEFLVSADQFDLIVAIDRMVIRKTCQKIASLLAKQPNIRLSLNLSAKSWEDANLASHVKNTIAEFGIPPERLAVEVPERILIEDPARAQRVANELAALGCVIMLDDVGVRFLEAEHLLPSCVTTVKLQGPLLHALTDSNAQLIQAVAVACRKRGIRVVAKFVEDPEIFDNLRALGVDAAQGFAVGRPLESVEEVR